MPVVRRSPLARLALRAASGWKAATPSPLRPNAASTDRVARRLGSQRQAAPASRMLAGNSQAIASAVGELAEERLHDRRRRADREDQARRRRVRETTLRHQERHQAGTTPWQKSIRKWPTDSRAMARLFIHVSSHDPGSPPAMVGGIIFAMMYGSSGSSSNSTSRSRLVPMCLVFISFQTRGLSLRS